MPELESLPDDIYNLFDPSKTHELSEDNLEEFCQNLKALLRHRFKEYTRPESVLRFSSLGKKDRQLWMEAHPDEANTEKMAEKAYLKFLYGDIIEQLILLLAKEAGHVVEDEQKEIELDGVKGHIDARIDGVITDVKSASPQGFQKFKAKTIFEDDPFGYVEQLAGYASEETPGKDAAWLAVDKVHGDICVTPLKKVVIDHYPPKERIEHLRKVIESDTPPGLCAEPIPDNKSGNLKLPPLCSYCSHKRRCYPGLRIFLYSGGPRYLTTVVRQPDVPEVTW